MKCLTTARIGLTILSLLILLPTSAVSVAAGRGVSDPLLHRGMGDAWLPRPDPPAEERCRRLEVISPLLWYATDAQGEADTDEVVESYPSGTIALAYGFTYKCVPPGTILTELFYALDYSDEPANSEDDFIPADPKRGGYYWTLTLKDHAPFPDGKYRVEFYLDEALLVSGEISVGDGGEGGGVAGDREIVAHAGRVSAEATPEPTEAEPTARPTRRPTAAPTEAPTEAPEPEATATPTRRPEPPARPTPTPDNKVQIDGQVLDGATGRPIHGAVFIVLQPGVSTARWADYGYPPSDILSSNKTDRDGRFRHPGLEIGIEYSIVVWALSYQGWWNDGFRLTESDPDPYPLTIQLYR